MLEQIQEEQECQLGGPNNGKFLGVPFGDCYTFRHLV